MGNLNPFSFELELVNLEQLKDLWVRKCQHRLHHRIIITGHFCWETEKKVQVNKKFNLKFEKLIAIISYITLKYFNKMYSNKF